MTNDKQSFQQTIFNRNFALRFTLVFTCALAAIISSRFWLIAEVQAFGSTAQNEPAHFPTLQGKAALSELESQGADGALKQALRAARSASSGAPVNGALAELTAVFNPLTSITANDGADGDLFGTSIAMSGDTVVVGAPGDNVNIIGGTNIDQGSAYVFMRFGAGFVFQQKLMVFPGASYSYFGHRVGISGDTIAVAAFYENSVQGAVYVYVRTQGTWSLQQRLTANDGLPNDAFGSQVTIEGNTIVAGAPTADINGSDGQGAAYVFVRSGSTWTQQQKLTASDGTAYNHFGTGIALQNGTLLIGADGGTITPGAVYIFTLSGTNWEQQQKLTSSDGVFRDRFGSAIALDGDTVVIGAPEVKISNQSYRGAAYIFVRSGATWNQQQKFMAMDGDTNDYFGNSVGISGNTAVIGSYFHGNPQNAAYVYTRSGTLWTQQQKLTFGNSNYGDMGGIAIKNGILLAGATRANNNGAVYAFEAPNAAPTITPFVNVSRQAGSNLASVLIATVNDVEDAEPDLQVTVNGGSSATVNGVSLFLTGISANGQVSANVATACNATTAQFTLRVTDSLGAFVETTLTITVTPNTPPVLTYSPAYFVSPGGSLTITPPSGPNDNGDVTSILIQNVFPDLTGTISINNQGVITVTNAGPVGDHTVTVVATDNCNLTTTTFFSVSVVPGVSGATNLQFYPLAHPVRLLDTRVGFTGCDAPAAKIVGNTSRTQAAAGRTCDGLSIPANAAALVGNATSVQSGGGYFTLYPSDIAKPNSANSNYAANQILNSLFTVRLGASDGAFKIFVSSDTDLVVDVTGYYAAPSASGLYFHPLPHPVRLLDTRAGASACFTPGAALQADSTTSQTGTTTCDSVLIPAGAQALTGNATTVSPQANGYLTLYPADAARPLIASANFQPGFNLNSPFMVGMSPSGQFNIYVASTTDLVIDVTGYYSTQMNDSNGQGLLFNALSGPVRLLDTRAGQQACFTPGAQMTGGTPYLQTATGACANIPAAAQAVVGNATTINAAANGYLTFWPSEANQPYIATSNYRTAITFNRHFTTGLGADGAFKRFAVSTTDLVVDLVGYFAP